MLASVFALPTSEQSLIAYAALRLLALTVAGILWTKFTALVAQMWRSFVEAIDAVEEFRAKRKKTS